MSILKWLFDNTTVDVDMQYALNVRSLYLHTYQKLNIMQQFRRI